MIRSLSIAVALYIGQPAQSAPSNQQVFDHLVEMEGYKHTPYRDRNNSWCVGIGHNLSAHKESVRSYYTDDKIVDLFMRDLVMVRAACREHIVGFDELPDTAQLAAINVGWTVGRTGLYKMWAFRNALGNRDFRLAANTLRHYAWWRQVGPRRGEVVRELLLQATR